MLCRRAAPCIPASQGVHQPGGGEEFPSDPKSGNSWTRGCVGRTREPGEGLSICCFCPALSQSLFPRKGKTQRPYYRAGKKAISFVALSEECGSPKKQLCSAVLTQSPGPCSANSCLRIFLFHHRTHMGAFQLWFGKFPFPDNLGSLLSHVKDCSQISVLGELEIVSQYPG